MVTGCRCHDVTVFGHGWACAAQLGPVPRTVRDWKAEAAERALQQSLEIAAAYDQANDRIMPRSKYAVTGGWLKKRG